MSSFHWALAYLKRLKASCDFRLGRMKSFWWGRREFSKGISDIQIYLVCFSLWYDTVCDSVLTLPLSSYIQALEYRFLHFKTKGQSLGSLAISNGDCWRLGRQEGKLQLMRHARWHECIQAWWLLGGSRLVERAWTRVLAETWAKHEGFIIHVALWRREMPRIEYVNMSMFFWFTVFFFKMIFFNESGVPVFASIFLHVFDDYPLCLHENPSNTMIFQDVFMVHEEKGRNVRVID